MAKGKAEAAGWKGNELTIDQDIMVLANPEIAPALAEQIKGKFVLIGGDIIDYDRALTPFSGIDDDAVAGGARAHPGRAMNAPLLDICGLAQRFGGKYSPDGSVSRSHDAAPGPTPPNRFDGQRPVRAGARSNLLFVVPLVFGLRAFQQPPAGMAFGLVALGLLLLSAWLTREGIRAQDAYEQRRVAKRPAIPRKIFGAVLMGLGLAAGGMMSDGGPVAAILFGVIGAALHLFSFGPDPLSDKGVAGIRFIGGLPMKPAT